MEFHKVLARELKEAEQKINAFTKNNFGIEIKQSSEEQLENMAKELENIFKEHGYEGVFSVLAYLSLGEFMSDFCAEKVKNMLEVAKELDSGANPEEGEKKLNEIMLDASQEFSAQERSKEELIEYLALNFLFLSAIGFCRAVSSS